MLIIHTRIGSTVIIVFQNARMDIDANEMKENSLTHLALAFFSSNLNFLNSIFTQIYFCQIRKHEKVASPKHSQVNPFSAKQGQN